MRSPYQILVFPFCKKDGEPLYALFKRSDDKAWRGIAGGGEDKETPVETVKREIAEEAGISGNSKIIKLSSVASIPVELYGVKTYWLFLNIPSALSSYQKQ